MPRELDSSADNSCELPDCWALPSEIDGNPVQQLVVPAGRAVLKSDSDGRTWAITGNGKWPVASDREDVAPPVPAVRLDGRGSAGWVGEVSRVGPGEVLESLVGRFRFTEGSLDGTRPGLRPPQLGAVHAVLGYWATAPIQPATVVMPTGTGKTDTMIGLFAAARPHRLLVVVPTDALRNQLARKFEMYGVLVAVGVLAEPVSRPAVGTVEHAFRSKANAIAFAERCNVIVATVAALVASPEDIRRSLVQECSHLFVDEAHHIAAKQWTHIRDYFPGKAVVQFTATPFRADGRHLGGRLIFAFPLREAQRQGYFAKIAYIPITDFVDPDGKIANRAVQRLREDLAAGLNHLLMARVKTIKRADEVITLYREIAPDLNPVKIHSGETPRDRRAALSQVDNGSCRIIVCVDMLGEGYDLPSLKVAAIHDAHKTLPVTLQFIGRFARVDAGKIGDACVVVNRPDPDYDESLHRLYADDADWNYIIREIAETAVGAEQSISDFDAGFGSSLPEEVPIRTLAPKMSTVVYRTTCSTWQPEAAIDYFGPERLLTPTIAINRQKNLAWLVTEERSPVRWGTLKTVEEITYNLYVLYWDSESDLLYINSSNNDSVHKKLAETVCNGNAEIIKGEVVYRVMAHVNRLVPTNVGLIDVRSRARRFSMHVGADVTEGFPVAEAQTKTKTNIFAFGFENGDRVSFGGSLKGRVWSYQAARSLIEWADWCDSVGAKLTDESISVDGVMRDFIRPMEVRERPKLVILGVDWPYEIYVNTSDEARLSYQGVYAQLIDADLRVTEHSEDGPVRFAVVTPMWTASYEAAFTSEGIVYRAIGPEARIHTARKENLLREMFADLGLKFFFEDDTTIELGGFLLRPPRNTPPFRADKLTAIDWAGIDIRKESQGAHRDNDSIQRHVIQRIVSERQWDVVIDDDGAGEAADIVALAVDGDDLLIRLVHCKYSSEMQPGARVGDLYELCGQAHKSVRWRRVQELIDHLIRRERLRQTKHGRNGFEVGDENVLRGLQYRIRSLRSRLEITVAQPGLSAAKVSEAQLQLLACAEVYLHETAMAKLDVLCSA
jgi:superfamily II DNA or RNA helicase